MRTVVTQEAEIRDCAATLTPLRPEDFRPAAELAAAVFGRPVEPSAEQVWHWRLLDNPAAESLEMRCGWLLRDSRDTPVGLMLNIPQRMWCNGREVPAFAASNYVVDQRYRQNGLLLANAFVKQSPSALLLNTTANDQAREIFRRFGFAELPAWNRVFLWVVNPFAVLGARLARTARTAGLASLADTVGRTPLIRKARFRKGWPASVAGIEVSRVEKIGEEFDELWQKLRSQFGLTAVRTARLLSWRFHSHPLSSRRCEVLAARDRQGTLLGYLAWRRADFPKPPLTRTRVIDLFAPTGDTRVTGALIRATIDAAAHDGAAVVEITHCAPALQRSFEQMNALSRISSSSGYLVKSGGLGDELPAPAEWHTTGWDGDFAF